MTIAAINFELSGGSFNVKRRRLATFTMTEVDGKVRVSDDRPSHAVLFFKDTEFASADDAVAFWRMSDDNRTIVA